MLKPSLFPLSYSNHVNSEIFDDLVELNAGAVINDVFDDEKNSKLGPLLKKWNKEWKRSYILF